MLVDIWPGLEAPGVKLAASAGVWLSREDIEVFL
jgi:hypothetical protein